MKKYNSQAVYEMLLQEEQKKNAVARMKYKKTLLQNFVPGADSFIRGCDRIIRLTQEINFPNTTISSDAFNFFRSVYRESEKN